MEIRLVPLAEKMSNVWYNKIPTKYKVYTIYDRPQKHIKSLM